MLPPMPTNNLDILRKGVFTREDTFYIAVGSTDLMRNGSYNRQFYPTGSQHQVLLCSD